MQHYNTNNINNANDETSPFSQAMQDNSIDAQPFNSKAYEWWDENGAFKTLHHINPIRANWIHQHIQNIATCAKNHNHLDANNASALFDTYQYTKQKELRLGEGINFDEDSTNGTARKNLDANNASALFDKCILDVGCGGGLLAEALAHKGYHLQGLDIAPDLIEVAQLHAMQSGLPIQYHCQHLNQFVASQQHKHTKFDVITCMEMLEHVDNPLSILQDCYALLNDGGLLFASTINRTLKAYTQAILLAEHVLKLVPKYTHFYDKFIQPSELIAMLEQTGFKVLAMDGLSYNPWLKQTTKVVDDVSINYMLVCQK